MTQRLVIPCELPALNQVIAESKSHYAKYAKLKREYTTLIAILARKSLIPIDGRVCFQFDWYCQTRRRDPDNVASAKKFILDGLVAAGILVDDGWDFVVTFRDTFYHDKENPRVEVYLEPNDCDEQRAQKGMRR